MHLKRFLLHLKSNKIGCFDIPLIPINWNLIEGGHIALWVNSYPTIWYETMA